MLPMEVQLVTDSAQTEPSALPAGPPGDGQLGTAAVGQ